MKGRAWPNVGKQFSFLASRELECKTINQQASGAAKYVHGNFRNGQEVSGRARPRHSMPGSSVEHSHTVWE
jgi:hypothetical protein